MIAAQWRATGHQAGLATNGNGFGDLLDDWLWSKNQRIT
jgi:hypothetical protein